MPIGLFPATLHINLGMAPTFNHCFRYGACGGANVITNENQHQWCKHINCYFRGFSLRSSIINGPRVVPWSISCAFLWLLITCQWIKCASNAIYIYIYMTHENVLWTSVNETSQQVDKIYEYANHTRWCREVFHQRVTISIPDAKNVFNLVPLQTQDWLMGSRISIVFGL